MPPMRRHPQNVLEGGADRKALRQLRDRFLEFHSQRLARTRAALGERQQRVLDLLPLLFQVNHPLLPGYLSADTPCGLTRYRPTKAEIQAAQRLTRSFTYRHQPQRKPQLHALFLMGSSGTIAQSEQSDLDVWLCHGNDLDAEQLNRLEQKATLISEWALTQGAELHFFPMNDESFRSGERAALSSENCGSTQHYLLLDEFYRTAIYLCGRYPLWWLVPSQEEGRYEEYANTLRRQRFIRSDEVIDFGGVPNIPPGEFVGAGIWQLYKAIESPYKSILKLLLTEAYAASGEPPLSLQLKAELEHGHQDLNALDPYLLSYHYLERYLQQTQQTERLELARRSFYYKVNKPLTRPLTGPRRSWQRALLEELTQRWGWRSEHLYNLDMRERWKAHRVINEQRLLVRELLQCYRFLTQYGRRHQATQLVNSQEMTILGRKLFAAFERRVGKFERINPGISHQLSEVRMHLQFDSSRLQWSLFTDEQPNQPLRQHESVIDLLGWAIHNGVLLEQTQLTLNPEAPLHSNHLQRLVRQLLKLVPAATTSVPSDAFHQPASLLRLCWFINVGVDPLEALHQQGITRITERTDSLSFSAMADNLVVSIDQIAINSWGEVSSRRFTGAQALLDCLSAYLEALPPESRPRLPSLYCIGCGDTRPLAIAQRVEALVEDLAACYYSGIRPPSARYLLRMGSQYHLLQQQQGVAQITCATREAALWSLLAQPQNRYSPLVLDRFAFTRTPLAAVCQAQQADLVQLFYRQVEQQAEVLISDERGSLFRLLTPFRDERTLFRPLQQFLEAVLFRLRSQGPQQIDSHDPLSTLDLDALELACYRLEQHDGSWVARLLEHQGESSSYIDVQALAERQNGRLLFTIYCDGVEYRQQELGEQFFQRVAADILLRRPSQERYPCYLTDLDLGDSQRPGQTVEYLHYKGRLERELNQALQQL